MATDDRSAACGYQGFGSGDHPTGPGCVRPKGHDGPCRSSAATKLDDALADVESFIVNGGYEIIFDGEERHAVQMDRRKALAAMSEVKNVLRKDGHRV